MQNIRGETGNLKTLEVWKARKGMESVESDGQDRIALCFLKNVKVDMIEWWKLIIQLTSEEAELESS